MRIMKSRMRESNAPADARQTVESGATPSMLQIIREYKDFQYLAIGTVGSQASQWILNIALAWLILELTDSALYVGLLGFAAGVPMILASVPSGILLDRVDRRTILIGCQASLSAVAVILFLAVWSDLATPAYLLAGMFVYGALMALNNAARQILVPATVPRPALPAAFGLNSAAMHASRIVGPSIAGVLIGLWGVESAIAFQLLVLAVAFAASIRLSAPDPLSLPAVASPGDILQGFSYMSRHPLLVQLSLLATIPMFFAFPYLQLLPVIARDVLEIGPDGLGLMLALSGVGAIAGGLITERVARIGPVGTFIAVATIGYGGVVLFVAFSTSVWLTISAIMIGSLSGSLFQSLNNSLFQLQLPDDVRGRVTGVYLLGLGTYALGGLPMGYLSDRFSPSVAISIGALTSSLLAGLLLILSPQLRALRSPTDSPNRGAAGSTK